MKEIERKFIVKPFSKEYIYNLVDMWRVEQFYLATGENEVRIRHCEDTRGNEYFFLTHKRGAGLVRKETEIPISREQYYTLADGLQAKPIRKLRYILYIDGKTMTIDYYFGIGLTVAEVEFDSEKEASRFTPPDFVLREITGNPAYTNQQIWEDINNGTCINSGEGEERYCGKQHSSFRKILQCFRYLPRR